MAITIERQPEDFTPVYNDMVFTVSSDNDTEPAFKVLADVYINAVLQFRYKLELDVEFNYAVVDVSTTVEDFVTSNVCETNSTEGIYSASDSVVTYEVRFGEEYEVAGVLTQFPDLTNVTLTAFNGSLTSNEFAGYTGGLVENSFNTNSPDETNVTLDNVGCVMGMVNSGTSITYLEIKTYDSTGILIETYRVDDNTGGGIKAYGFASHPININNIAPGNFSLPVGPVVQPIIDSLVGHYTISVVTSGGNFKPIQFNVLQDCDIYTHQTLLFLNRLGGFDSFTFTKVSRESISTQRKSFKTNPRRLQSDGSYIYSKADRTNVNYITTTKNSLKLNSDWITEDESAWLRELITSPEIYLWDGSDLVAVQEVKQTNYEIHKDENGELFNLSIDVLMSADDERQRF